MLRTLVLDLDGTLVDSAPDITAALNRMMQSRGAAPFTIGEAERMIGNGARVLVERACEARHMTFDEAAFDLFLADYGDNAAVETRPFPGAADALAAMQSRGWQFALCTNKPYAATMALLQALELEQWFAAIGGGDSFGFRKPDPRHLLTTLAQAGGMPHKAVMVGDHHNDVLAANGAAIPCIFANWGYGSPDMRNGAAAEAACFAEIPALADRLAGAGAD